MDKQTAELIAMQALLDVRAFINRAASVNKEKREEKEWKAEEAALLGTANAHFNTLDEIMRRADLTPRDIGTKKLELDRLRIMVEGNLTFSIPPPRKPVSGIFRR